ncbi:MAG: hypothetical protein ACK47B_06010 [Armatimonadota bacterium]
MERLGSVYDHLQKMRARLEMYLGDRSILKLEHYLNGYEAALTIHGIEEGDRPRFSQFLSWLWWTRPGNWQSGWARGLAETSEDNEEALERFFDLAAEFGRLQVLPGETLDLPPGHQRSKAYHRLNRERPMPERLQLMYLRPGEWCYLRSWYEWGAQDERWLHSSVAGVVWLVEWEFGIPAGNWGIAIPEPDPSSAALQRRWEEHQRASDRACGDTSPGARDL